MSEKSSYQDMDGLTEGRIVHYILNEGKNKGAHRPAMVVRVWRVSRDGVENAPPKNGVCQLQVFTDGDNDGLPAVMWKTSVINQALAIEPGTWHWVEQSAFKLPN